MGDRCVLVDAHGFRVINIPDGRVRIIVGKDTITARYMDRTIHGASGTMMGRSGIGIAAPRHYEILRGELITP
jgi:hypothetical protein